MDRLERVRVRFDTSTPREEAAWEFSSQASPTHVLIWKDAVESVRLHDKSGICRQWPSAIEALSWLETSTADPEFTDGRWIGFLSYDLGRVFEKLPVRAEDDLKLPLFVFTFHRNVAQPLIARGDCAKDVSSLSKTHPSAGSVASTFSQAQYLEAVERAMAYIAAGDIFQVNLSQRLTVPQTDSVDRIYDRLQQATPARYGACLDYGSFALICNSPELFLRVRRDPQTGRRHIVTRPIKGTRPRGAGMEAALRDSAKDQAELNMIVDLERNDLGRICEIGSVKVTEARTIEAHPTVYQGVATIEGTLRDDVNFPALLRAMFPGGSVTGAPKIRAMQIIEELEPVRRGPYCGAIGYLAPGGAIEFNIAIRTMIVKDGNVHIPVGGGIVADSDPQAEYDETLVKARAMLEAVGPRE